VARGAAVVLDHLDVSLAAATAERTAAEEARAERDRAIAAERERVRALAAELDDITSSVHRDELARAAQRMRVENRETKALEELGVDPDTLVDEYGPHLPVPMPPDDAGEPVDPIPYVREEQLKRMRKAERGLTLLGKVNPLALEEYAALEERHQFLTEQ